MNEQKPENVNEAASAQSELNVGLEVKAAAFDAIVKMLSGSHREIYPVNTRVERSADGSGFTQIPVHIYQWVIEMEGTTDIAAGFIKLVSSNVELRGDQQRTQNDE